MSLYFLNFILTMFYFFSLFQFHFSSSSSSSSSKSPYSSSSSSSKSPSSSSKSPSSSSSSSILKVSFFVLLLVILKVSFFLVIITTKKLFRTNFRLVLKTGVTCKIKKKCQIKYCINKIISILIKSNKVNYLCP